MRVVNGVIKGTPVTLSINQTPVGNTTSGTVNLMSFSLPANTLSTNGDSVRILMRGRYGSDPSAFGQYGLTVGGVTIFENDLADLSAVPMGYNVCFEIEIFRDSATTGKVLCRVLALVTNSAASDIQVDVLQNGGNPQNLLTLAPSITWSSANTIQVYGILTGASTANLITQDLLQVVYNPNA